MDRATANSPRYDRAGGGHYESYFLRANDPERALGFWLRYTVFAPAGRPDAAEAELWAAVFTGEPGATVAIHDSVPLTQASFAGGSDGLAVRIGAAILRDDPAARRGSLRGTVAADGHEISWDLTYEGGDDPVLLLAERLYNGRFPAAKSLVPVPLAVFTGQILVDGEPVEVAGWTGSQNHNWGSKHTDEYAWGQVAGFDNAPDSFLECSTARVRVAGVRTPPLTLVVLRHDGREYALNSLAQARRARGTYHASGPEYTWTLRSDTRDEAGSDITISAEFGASAGAFVTFGYRNPPGGTKTCLNTKIAQCRLTIARTGTEPVIVRTAHRAAFEILG